LDEQNARILTKLEELRAMRDTFEQFRQELTKIMNTEEFIAAFEHELDSTPERDEPAQDIDSRK
jgi:hypothetical protein